MNKLPEIANKYNTDKGTMENCCVAIPSYKEQLNGNDEKSFYRH